MSDPVVRLEDSRLAVQPGGQARTRVTVANTGQVVEGFRVEVVGPAAAWAEVTPPELQVYPHQEGTALVAFSPPAGRSTPSGALPFGVRARSVVDQSRCATEEGDLEVGAVFGLQGTLIPVTSSGRWSAAHAVELANWGNVAERLHVTARDPDDQLAFLVHPQDVDLPVGGKSVVDVRVRARRPVVRGARTRRPFQVVAQPDTPPNGPPPPAGTDPSRVVVDGTLEVKPILSRTAVAGAGLAVLALGGAVTWALLTDSAPPASALPLDPAVVAPTGLVATSQGAEAVALAWTAPDRVDGYELHHLDPATQTEPLRRITKSEPLDRTLEGHTVEGLAAATTYCFELVTVRAEARSQATDPACATTEAAPAETPGPVGPTPTDDTESPSGPGSGDTPTPPEPSPPDGSSESPPDGEEPGGDLRPDEWIVVVRITPTTQGDALPRQHAERLRSRDYNVAEVLNTEYPELEGGGVRGGAESSLLVVRTGAASEADAEAFCNDNPEMDSLHGCRYVTQPGPRVPD